MSQFSIRRPVTVVMVVVAMLIFGFISFPKMAVDLFPEMNLPVAVVVTNVDGETPAEVEKLVTKPIEEALASVSNVDTISSNSVGTSSQVIVQFNWGTNIDQATLDMRDKIDQVRGMLPDTAKNPRIMKFDPNSQPIMTLALTGKGDLTELKSIADNLIKPRLERIDGVASLGINGGRDRVIDVIPDPNKLESYGITLDQLKQAIASTNLSGSAGAVRVGDEKQQIQLKGEYKSVQAIGETPIAIAGGSSIPLRSIAEIKDTLTDESQLAYFNGKPSLGLSLTKASGGNTVEVADQVHQELTKLQKALPKGTELTMVTDTSKYITDSINTVAEHALLGGLFAVVVLFFFLNSVRTTLIVSIVMPISVIATFTLMYFTGQTINLISLSGLMLGLGSLVDFAVVILENIFRFRQLGKGMLEAAQLGSRQVGNAVMASAMAQIVVFLPIVFVDGLAAELFRPLALTVIFSHVAALVVSLMLVPMLSSKWMKKVPDEALYRSGTYHGMHPAVWFNIGFVKVSDIYGRVLAWALRHRKKVFVLTLAMFVASIALSPLVGMEFMPKMDQGQLTISVKMPTGTVLEQTEKAVSQIESVVKKVPELDKMYTSIGSSGGPAALSANSANRASISVMLVDQAKRTRSTEQVVEDLKSKLTFIPDADLTIQEAQGGGMGGAALQVNLRGPDLGVLKDISSIIAGEMKKVKGTTNVATSLDASEQEYQVVVDAQRASAYGLTTSQILSYVRTAFNGQKVSTYRTGDDEIDINLKMPKKYSEDETYLDRLRITAPGGATIPLSAVTSIVKKDVPQTIKRTDQTREVQITSDITGRDLGSITKDVQARLAKLHLPDGYQLTYGGQSNNMTESFSKLGLAMLLSIVLVYMVMAGQFESYFSPFIIMFSIPPTFIGVVLGLLVTHKPLSIMALIGYILLIGIVVNNAIVLIDYINTLRKEGMDRDQAVMQAGPIRLRPILMTTMATILAILPLAFGGGAGNEGQAPMAIVVTFGLSFSTMVTLVLIPVVYTWFDDLGQKFRNRKMRKKQKKTTSQNFAG